MVNKDIIKGSLFTLMIISIVGIIYAAGFHYANEIVPGGFQEGDYWFNGNVGVGTNSPEAKLEILGENDQLLLSTNGQWSSIYPWANGNNTGALVWRNNGETRLEGRTATGFIRFGTGGTSIERMRITSSGNVGIGTTDPQAKLHVAGNLQVDGNILGGITLNCTTVSNSYTSSGQGWKSISVSCPVNYTVLGCGDGTQFSGEHWGRYSYFNENGCTAGVYNNDGYSSTYISQARCCKIN